jgi:hypothetical protein
MLSVCLCFLHINLWKSEPIFMKLGICVMVPKPIPSTYYINPSHQSVCLYVHPPIVAKQQLGKTDTAATNTHATIEELLDASFLIETFERDMLRSAWRLSPWLARQAADGTPAFCHNNMQCSDHVDTVTATCRPLPPYKCKSIYS